MTEQTYLTTDEVAAEIRKSTDYVQRLCKAGTLKARKLGNDWRIRRTDLEAFMAGNTSATARTRLSSRQQKRIRSAS